MTEQELIGQIALVTADTRTGNCIVYNGEKEDSTNIYSWCAIWGGIHFSFDAMRADCSELPNYKAVLVSGNPGGYDVAMKICKYLKDTDTVVAFIPEGDISQYDLCGISSFNRYVYDIWNAVDVIFSFEDDKIDYYNSFTDTPAHFVHVPLSKEMSIGNFMTPRSSKKDCVLVYGDNNPNCPLTALMVARSINKPVITVSIKKDELKAIKEIFNVNILYQSPVTIPQNWFLRVLGQCRMHIYPTRWIGSSRQSISCAVVGTPCVGSDRSHTQRRLFPSLCSDIYDVKKMKELSTRLFEDNVFYDEVVAYAWEASKFYNLENTKKRFVEACTLGEEYKKRRKQ